MVPRDGGGEEGGSQGAALHRLQPFPRLVCAWGSFYVFVIFCGHQTRKTFSLYAYGPLFSLNIVLHTSVADLKCLNSVPDPNFYFHSDPNSAPDFNLTKF